MKRKINYLKRLKRLLKFKDFETLNDDICVYIKDDYFWYLFVRARNIASDNEEVMCILNKYRELKRMKDYIRKFTVISEYHLMTSYDAKMLIKVLKITEFKNVFYRSNIKVDVYEEWMEYIEKEYQSRIKKLNKV